MNNKNALSDKSGLFSRRDFIKTSCGLAAAGIMANTFADLLSAQNAVDRKLIWANLIHLGYNMWADRKIGPQGNLDPNIVIHNTARPYLRCDQQLWDDIVKTMSNAKMNMLVIDLGEGIKYESHPELAVENSWSPKKLKSELKKIREMGIEPIPKLNFSTTHDLWLGPYSRMVSTPEYYKVCKELISEVIDLFDKPRFFHIGYDEEDAKSQINLNYVVIRQHDLWWHDFNFISNEVLSHKVRPWIWADYVWAHGEEFYKQMPKSVLLSSWYYGTDFETEKENKEAIKVKPYIELDQHGYDQIPTASTWRTPENFSMTVDFCEKHISQEHLFGFLQTPWLPTLEIFRQRHMEAIEVVKKVIDSRS